MCSDPLTSTRVRPLALVALSSLLALLLTIWPFVAYAVSINVDGVTCTLPHAIEAANTDAPSGLCPPGNGDDLLLLAPTTHALASGPYLANGGNATPSITTNIVISGGTGAIVRRSGGDPYRLFHVAAGGNLTLENVTVRDGNIGQDGGGIYNLGILTVIDSEIVSNTADFDGGGLYTFSGSSVLMIRSQIRLNDAQFGGGVYLRGATATITSSQILSNTARLSGGGLYVVANATTSLSDTLVAGNSSFSYGGGVVNEGVSFMTISGSQIAYNAEGFGDGGGGIRNHFGSTLLLTDTAIFSNTTNNDGGGLYNGGSSTTRIRGGRIFDNQAKGNGGGIYNEISTLMLDDGTEIATNKAGSGGGIYNLTGTMDVTGTLIYANSANQGGGINQSGNATIRHTLLIANRATDGSAILQPAGITAIHQSCIVDNSDTAVVYGLGAIIQATENWWGALDGPSGVGPGSGDSIGVDILFDPFINALPAHCPLPELTLSNSADPVGPLLPGEPLTFTLAIANNALVIAKGITVTNSLPGDFALEKVQTSGPITKQGTNSFVISTLSPTQVATILLQGRTSAAISQDQRLTHSASLTNAFSSPLNATAAVTVALPRLNWSAATYVTGEEGGPFAATVTLTPPHAYATVAVNARYSDTLHALTGQQTITFTPGSSTQPFVVPVTDDAGSLPYTMLLALQSPSGAHLGATANASIFVTEDDMIALMVDQSVNATRAAAGDSLIYTYQITNTGNVSLTIHASDDRLGTVGDLAGLLGPNTTRSATLTYGVQPSDALGAWVNTVTVTGTDALANNALARDSVSVEIVAPGTVIVDPPPNVQPGLVVDTVAEPIQAAPGELITYSYQITNTGNVTLTIDTTDDRLGKVAGLDGPALAPGETRGATLAYHVPESAAPGPWVNTVTVTGTDALSNQVVAVDSATITVIDRHVNPPDNPDITPPGEPDIVPPGEPNVTPPSNPVVISKAILPQVMK